MNKRPPPRLGFNQLPFARRLSLILEANYCDDRFGVAQLAQLLCLCPMQVHRNVKKHTGQTPGKHLLLFRLSKAKDLLSTTELSVGEIAWQCGFRSHAAFSRAFHRTYHFTPSQMRSQMTKEVINW